MTQVLGKEFRVLLDHCSAVIPVGQEFFVAWSLLLFGGDVPLHVFSVWMMAICAALVAAGVYGLTLEVTGSVLISLTRETSCE